MTSIWSVLASISAWPFTVISSLTLFIARLTAFTLSQTITLDFYSLLILSCIIGFLIWLLIRYRFLNKYTRLPLPTKKQSPPFDLHPDTALDEEYGERGSYGDEFMGAFLSSIKVFGYLDR